MKIAGFLLLLSVSNFSFASDSFHKVSTKLIAGLSGGNYSLNYEKKFSSPISIEAGVKIGENFLRLFANKITYMGLSASANFHIKEWDNTHRFFISTTFDTLFGKFYSQTNADNSNIKVVNLNNSISFMYNYKFPYNILLETGLTIETVSLVLPLEKNKPISWYSLPLPKINIGIGYMF